MTKSLKPKLRFKGFSDDWKQYKIYECADCLSGNGLSWNDIQETGQYECILYGNLYTDYGMIIDSVKYKTNVIPKNVTYSEYGDVLIPGSDTTPIGLARAASIEKSGVLLGGDINVIRPKSMVNGSCLSLAFNANKKELLKLVKGTTVRHIHNSDIKNIELTLPVSKIEQGKNIHYFKLLDNLITLQQRKLDKISNLKKAMLAKMFPKNGSDTPEVRFKGFSDNWKKYNLGDIAQYRNGKAHEREISDYGKYIVVNSKFVSTNGYIYKFSNKQLEPLYKNEIAFVLSDVPNGKALAKTFLIPDNNKYTLNQRIAALRVIEPNISFFLNILMNRNTYFLQFDDGVKQTNLSILDVMKFESYYPLKSEQQKIGTFFSNLDNLITLYQQKLEKLKNIKKSCLEKMFV